MSRIMLVEDEWLIGAVLQSNLEQAGYQVVANVGTEEAAVRSALDVQPDLVLMDINLGRGGDGIEACGKIREQADIPVVFLSAYSDPATVRRACAQAPYGYLVKPVHEPTLRPLIESALRRHEVDMSREQRIEALMERQELWATVAGVAEMCHRCGRVCRRSGTWTDLAALAEQADADAVSHGLCDLCKTVDAPVTDT